MSETIKILVTDSGLGGLALAAGLFEKIKLERRFEKAQIVFFNCRPADHSGYAAFADDSRRAAVFSGALSAMHERFQPDRIVIACNTLSVVYEQTEFAQIPPVPVTGIIEDGVVQIAELLNANPGMRILLLGTPVTVNSGAHKKLLNKMGIDSGRLHYQACPGLPEAISRGARSGEVRNMVRQFMNEAVGRAGGKKFALGLLCTHFAYSLPFFAESASNNQGFSGDIVLPESALVDSVLANYGQNREKAVNLDLSIKCFTHTAVNREARCLLYPLIKEISPATAAALLEMEHIPGMFSR